LKSSKSRSEEENDRCGPSVGRRNRNQIEKGGLYVSYDPLATTEKKIEQAIRSTGTTIKAAATDTEGARPDLLT